MSLPVEWFVGSRYIYARRGNHFIAFISLTAVLGTATGVAVLVTILSIMNGFEGELLGRILGMSAHLEMRFDDTNSAASDKAALNQLLRQLENSDELEAAAPFIRRDVLLQINNQVQAVEARGIDSAAEAQLTALERHMVAGEHGLVAGEFRLLIGQELAEQLRLAVGDSVNLLSPQPIVTPAGLIPRMKRFVVGGIFEYGVQSHDGALALIHISDATRFFRSPRTADGIRLRVSQADRAPLLKTSVADSCGCEVRDWTQTHRNLFRALKMEKIAMFIILAMAIAIAAFNVISILVVAVIEKRGDIAMLKSLGLSQGAVMRIFMIQGGVTGVLGVMLGLLAGFFLASHIDTLVAWVEYSFNFKILSPDVYYISTIPSKPEPGDFWLAGIFASLLTVCAPLYPAWLAARQSPIAGLRNE